MPRDTARQKKWPKSVKGQCLFPPPHVRLPAVDDCESEDPYEVGDAEFIPVASNKRIDISSRHGLTPLQILSKLPDRGRLYLDVIGKDTCTQIKWDPHSRLHALGVSDYDLDQARLRVECLLTCALFNAPSHSQCVLEWNTSMSSDLLAVEIKRVSQSDTTLYNIQLRDTIPTSRTQVDSEEFANKLFNSSMSTSFEQLENGLTHALYLNHRVGLEMNVGKAYFTGIDSHSGSQINPAEFNEALNGAASVFDTHLQLSEENYVDFYESFQQSTEDLTAGNFHYKIRGTIPVSQFDSADQFILRPEMYKRGFVDVTIVIFPRQSGDEAGAEARHVYIHSSNLVSVPWMRPHGVFDMQLSLRSDILLHSTKKYSFTRIIKAFVKSVSVEEGGPVKISQVTPDFCLETVQTIMPRSCDYGDFELVCNTVTEWIYDSNYSKGPRHEEHFTELKLVNSAWNYQLGSNAKQNIGVAAEWTVAGLFGPNGKAFCDFVTLMRRLMLNLDIAIRSGTRIPQDLHAYS